MEFLSKILERRAFITRNNTEKEEHMLINSNKSIHEEHLSQPLQTNYEQF